MAQRLLAPALLKIRRHAGFLPHLRDGSWALSALRCSPGPIFLAGPFSLYNRLSSKLAIDLVITDVRMTGDMDGVALAEWIAEHRLGVEVVLTSAFSRPAEMSVTAKYPTKPYTGRALFDLAKEALARQSLPVGPKTD
jgi:DNA-binding NtrC family response regulator